MSDAPFYRLVLAKEDFKFSVAHFTLFSGTRAELLHGHNYQVSLELAGRELDEWGLLADVDAVKQAVRALCRRLDSHTLIPEASPALAWSRDDGQVEVRFGERTYRLPAEDVLPLPLANTSMELLARYFWTELAATLGSSRVERLAVAVEETHGQRCWYEAPLTRRQEMEDPVKKLVLDKETLRELGTPDLDQIQGGAGAGSDALSCNCTDKVRPTAGG